ncbi:DUF6950 family protein [Sphingobium chungbukense]|uniref:DUF6950 domain-containing protein n=1 Tax=Sphingobium chungbukense TaxID=56193 RepID=A0A0M3ATI4_9SPHN|nr:hypothetical protein YP76_09935 [Sphingobium chungbukense]
MSDLLRRAEATRLTINKYRARPFDWKSRSTCIHMARTHLRNMGHRPPPIPDFRSVIGARRALQNTGFDNLTALLDSLLPRIAPAEMLVGDIAILPGDEGMEGIVISAGGKLIGYNEDAPDGVKPLMALVPLPAAWRA